MISKKLVTDVHNEVQGKGSFTVLMMCSGILTAIALLTNSVPVLIGAMVVAPLLAPIQLVAFGIVSGQYKLALKGFMFSFGGLFVAVFLTGLTTYLLNLFNVIDANANLTQKPLLEERVRPGIYSLLVPFTAGIAGTLAMVKKKMDALVGVVASVALVPAAGAGTISLLSNDLARTLGGFTLFLVNYLIITGTAIIVLALVGNKLNSDD